LLSSRGREAAEGPHPQLQPAYHLSKLVYAEAFPYARDGIAQEKQIEGWRRARKVVLIERVNPHWTELSPGRL
jgi:putative endonuclease